MRDNCRNIVSFVMLSNGRLGYSVRTRVNPERRGITFDAYGHYCGLDAVRPLIEQKDRQSLMDAVGAPLANEILQTLREIDLDKYKD